MDAFDTVLVATAVVAPAMASAAMSASVASRFYAASMQTRTEALAAAGAGTSPAVVSAAVASTADVMSRLSAAGDGSGATVGSCAVVQVNTTSPTTGLSVATTAAAAYAVFANGSLSPANVSVSVEGQPGVTVFAQVVCTLWGGTVTLVSPPLRLTTRPYAVSLSLSSAAPGGGGGPDAAPTLLADHGLNGSTVASAVTALVRGRSAVASSGSLAAMQVGGNVTFASNATWLAVVPAPVLPSGAGGGSADASSDIFAITPALVVTTQLRGTVTCELAVVASSCPPTLAAVLSTVAGGDAAAVSSVLASSVYGVGHDAAVAAGAVSLVGATVKTAATLASPALSTTLVFDGVGVHSPSGCNVSVAAVCVDGVGRVGVAPAVAVVRVARLRGGWFALPPLTDVPPAPMGAANVTLWGRRPPTRVR